MEALRQIDRRPPRCCPLCGARPVIARCHDLAPKAAETGPYLCAACLRKRLAEARKTERCLFVAYLTSGTDDQ